MRTTEYTITVPGDLFGVRAEEVVDRDHMMRALAEHAISEAREEATDYVMPARWDASHISGEVGDHEIIFKVVRTSN